MVEEYLAELERTAVVLPLNRRAELLADVHSHIAVARAETAPGTAAGAEDDAAVRRILSQLGDPQEIVATALSDLPPGTQPDSRTLEITTVLLLLFGGFLAGIGWLIGVVLLWSSRRWTRGDKLLGTLLIPGGLALPTVLAAAAFGLAASGGGWLGPATVIALIAVLLIAPVFTAIRLARRGSRSLSA
jgi:hypothetical protein